MGIYTPSTNLADKKTAVASDILGLITEFNGSIDKANVDTTAEIMCSDLDKDITATYTYLTKPDISADPLIATDVDETEIATRGGVSPFTAKQTFTAGLDASGTIYTAIVERVATGSIPAASAGNKGRILYDTTANKFYGCDGSAWVDLGQTTGAYAGGTRSYNANLIVDAGESAKMLVKVDAVTTAVKVFFQGDKFPTAFYTELGQHNHSLVGGTATSAVTDAGHDHDVAVGSHTHSTVVPSSTHTHTSFHDHNKGTLAGTTSTHDHGGYTGDSFRVGSTVLTHNHTIPSQAALSVSITGTVTPTNAVSGGPSATNAIASYDYGTITSTSETTGISVATTLSGNVTNTGVNAGTVSTAQKTYHDSLQIWIGGVDKTADVLTATGWTEIGDGTNTHAFVTNGTGEIDLFAAFAVGINTIEFKEPTSAKGGRVLVHIEVS